MAAVIKSVEPGSYADAKGIKSGCTLLKINGHEIVDVLDYRFYMMDQKLDLVYKDERGRFCMARIVKDDEYDDIGLDFETYLIDKQHSCTNKCIFCFVDQLPKGMRESLYFKDDDSRMSFFYGNYITLTNMKDEDIDRIIKMHISPINVSVHTMNPELRCKMMNNRFAGDSLRHLKTLADAGIKINTQLVLCPGINDGRELVNSIVELYKLSPAVQSIACVPVGLTKYREGLFELSMYTEDQARKTIKYIDMAQAEIKPKLGTNFVYASDEFYLYAGLPIPEADYYDDYPQLDNGVGLLRLFETEAEEALAEVDKCEVKPHHFTFATGVAASSLIQEICMKIYACCEGAKLSVETIKNELFGETITVAGLLTGQDIINQLKGKDLGEILFLPKVLLRSGETVLLDDVSIEDIEKELQVKVQVIDNDGYEFVETVINNLKEVE